jgi:hypothetical protein
MFAACLLMSAVLFSGLFLTRDFFLEATPHILRILALVTLVGGGVLTYFAAAQFLRAMTLRELRDMLRRKD